MAEDEKPKRRPVGAYAVGYCRPPEATRFKPGASGNPKGTRKRRLSIAELVDAELNKVMAAKAGGEVVNLAKRELLAKRIVADALQGDRHSQKLALALAAQAQVDRDGGTEAPLTQEEIDQLMALVRFKARADEP